VTGRPRDQLIAGILVQFERNLHLVQSPEWQLLQGAPGHEAGV
jgi:choline/glycine/proline betaine transport protein